MAHPIVNTSVWKNCIIHQVQVDPNCRHRIGDLWVLSKRKGLTGCAHLVAVSIISLAEKEGQFSHYNTPATNETKAHGGKPPSYFILNFQSGGGSTAFATGLSPAPVTRPDRMPGRSPRIRT